MWPFICPGLHAPLEPSSLAAVVRGWHLSSVVQPTEWYCRGSLLLVRNCESILSIYVVCMLLMKAYVAETSYSQLLLNEFAMCVYAQDQFDS